ncbi:MAG: peptide chain release factor 2 [Candidatus Omnitrophica bacterium]|nr:peptide chain release factor 2 [Candidatus Omnitrophota bacterium]MDD5237478.1 peptide chain release factor 2 [Candidatus Omnitrophota bacterium]
MLEDLKAKLLSIHAHLDNLRGYLDVDNKKRLIDDLSLQLSQPGFWENAGDSARTVKQLKNLKSSVEPWEAAFKKYQELEELTAILKASDKELISDLTRNIDVLTSEIEKLEFKTVLGDELDRNSAILSINAGAGGTESCDWVGMILRMYTRFAENHKYNVKTIDILPGEEAGIKNVMILIEGEYAYGYLKAERGVHRLVRISPFDANKRRHTSFASVDVIPEVEEDTDIKLEEKDLRIEVYRSKGAGGQSVNTTDSAVRITHIPTNLVAQCQNERSQYQNKQTALKILKARIYELEREKKEKEMLKQYAGEKKKIEWGSQIRSYVLHPYNMVKDHRTDYETGDTSKVLDGGIDEFIEAYLKSQLGKRG